MNKETRSFIYGFLQIFMGAITCVILYDIFDESNIFHHVLGLNGIFLIVLGIYRIQETID